MMTELAIGVALCSLLIATAGLMALMRLQAKQRTLSDSMEQRLHTLEKQIATATAGSVGVGKRLVALEQELQSLAAAREGQDFADDRQEYTQAMQMLDQGADIDTVVASCGLSRSEAQLMALVRKQTAGKAQTAPVPKSRERR